jgi:chromosome segregation ATPase
MSTPSSSNQELDMTLRRVEAQEATARKRVIIFTALPILLGLSFLIAIGQSAVQARRELTAKNEELKLSREELAKYTQPPSRIREELEEYQGERLAAYQALDMTLNGAVNVQSQLVKGNQVFATDLSSLEKRLQDFSRDLQVKIDVIKKRLDEIKKSRERGESEQDERRKRGDLTHETVGPSGQELDLQTLLNALNSQRQIVTDVLRRAKSHQTDMADLNQKLKEALDKNKNAQTELDAKDQKIIELCRVAATK